MSRRGLRVAAGVLVLVGSAVVCLKLLPVYWGAYRFQQYLNELAARPEAVERPQEWVRAMILNRAADLSLPVRSDQIRLARTEGRLWMEVRYVAPVKLAFYSVDLHFRPRAASP